MGLPRISSAADTPSTSALAAGLGIVSGGSGLGKKSIDSSQQRLLIELGSSSICCSSLSIRRFPPPVAV